MSKIISKDDVFTLNFLFNQKDKFHYWCLTSIIVPGYDCYKPTKNLELFFIDSTNIPGGDCDLSALFSDKLKECNRYETIQQLDRKFSKNNIVPDGYINSQTGDIILFKSEYLLKVENPYKTTFNSKDNWLMDI